MELSSFCSEVALMLGAGMALYSGMEALEKTYENDPHAQLYQAISSGVVEKPTMPSMEYLNRPQKFHLVVPATRSMFS